MLISWGTNIHYPTDANVEEQSFCWTGLRSSLFYSLLQLAEEGIKYGCVRMLVDKYTKLSVATITGKKPFSTCIRSNHFFIYFLSIVVIKNPSLFQRFWQIIFWELKLKFLYNKRNKGANFAHCSSIEDVLTLREEE